MAGLGGIPPPLGFWDVWLQDGAHEAENCGGDPHRGRCGGPQRPLRPVLCPWVNQCLLNPAWLEISPALPWPALPCPGRGAAAGLGCAAPVRVG